jgi:dihydrofolate reductase
MIKTNKLKYMRSLVSFMHVSLDGFVCGPNGEMDWIKVDDEIFDYAGNRTSVSDTALYGRVTWEMMEGYWPTAADKPNASKHDIEHSTWYNKVDKVVLSKSMKGKQLPNTVNHQRRYRAPRKSDKTTGGERDHYFRQSRRYAFVDAVRIDR